MCVHDDTDPPKWAAGPLTSTTRGGSRTTLTALALAHARPRRRTTANRRNPTRDTASGWRSATRASAGTADA
eukprot:6182196-Pleurochrysis_carterae.AAC.1